MIFVTIGNSTWNFTRLVKEIDSIAGKIDEEIIMQIGHTEYEPKNTRYFKFISKEKIEKLYESARVVISHAGIGSIISASRHNKPIILVPRRKKYGEHFDDHQVEIAGEMEKEGRITVVHDVEELEAVLTNVSAGSVAKVEKDDRLVRELKDYLYQLELE